MKQITLIRLLLIGVIIELFYVGGYTFLIGLGVMELTGIILLSFMAWAMVANKLMTNDAKFAI